MQTLMVLCFLAAIFIPAVLMQFGFESDRLQGEEEIVLSRLTPSAWLDGSFQQNFDTWFSKRYPGRTVMLEAYTAWGSVEDQIAQRVLPEVSEPVGEQGALKTALAAQYIAERESYAAPKFPEFAMDIPEAENQSPFRGDRNVLVGKDGVLFQQSYIHEAFGLSPRYTDVTNEYLQMRADKLLFIQQELEKRGIAFTVMFSPNKAVHYADYVPQWYLNRYSTTEGYERPYTRFLNIIKDTELHYIKSEDIFKENGLTNIFPMTGAHWNDIATALVTQELIETYQRLTGEQTPQLRITGVEKTVETYNSEHVPLELDLIQTLYAGRSVELQNAIYDPYYYHTQIETLNESAPPIEGLYLQGGSFRWGINDWLLRINFASAYYGSFYANTNEGLEGIRNWADLLDSVSYVVFDINEQYVYNIGYSFDTFGEDDVNPLPSDRADFNIHDSLYAYLKYQEDTVFHDDRMAGDVVLGENGQLFSKESINEYYGLQRTYTQVTDAYLQEQATRFSTIEEALRKRGIGFSVVFTPSKASQFAQDIPMSYVLALGGSEDGGYVRPYTRFKKMLDQANVTYLDSATVFAEKGISDTFAPTSSHWSKPASVAVTQALLELYEGQTGRTVRKIETIRTEKTKEPVPFYIFGNEKSYDANLLTDEVREKLAYSTDDVWYYTPDVKVTNLDAGKMGNIYLRGTNEFLTEVEYWLSVIPVGEDNNHVASARQFYGNNDVVDDWEGFLNSAAFVVFEVNEETVYRMDGEVDTMGNSTEGFRFVQSLYEHLTK